MSDPKFLTNGIPWEKISYLDYKKIQEESDYAAWVLSHGYIANHFTVSVTDCTFFKNLKQKLNLNRKNNKPKRRARRGHAEGGAFVFFSSSACFSLFFMGNFNEFCWPGKISLIFQDFWLIFP